MFSKRRRGLAGRVPGGQFSWENLRVFWNRAVVSGTEYVLELGWCGVMTLLGPWVQKAKGTECLIWGFNFRGYMGANHLGKTAQAL